MCTQRYQQFPITHSSGITITDEDATFFFRTEAFWDADATLAFWEAKLNCKARLLVNLEGDWIWTATKKNYFKAKKQKNKKKTLYNLNFLKHKPVICFLFLWLTIFIFGSISI